MSASERLRQLIDRQYQHLCANVPTDRSAATLAILRARVRHATAPEVERPPDLITGHRLADLGGNKALAICFESSGDRSLETEAPGEDLDHWAEGLLQKCSRLAEAELVLAHCETGFMQMVDGDGDTFDCWITTKMMPASWREREDIEWWDRLLASRHERDARAAVGTDVNEPHAVYRELAGVRLAAMGYQLGLPAEATIGGCTMAAYGDVLRSLIERALQARDRGEEVLVRSERELIDEVAAELSVALDTVARALEAFTVEAGNAAWHAAVPSIAAAPVVRFGPDHVALSVHGLTTEPMFFLARELRRRHAEEYHNMAHLREDAFRDDLYDLFRDKRFATSSGRIKVRRAEGNIRTDIDAAVFDRKTGTLGVFELKSQDPFARSTAELMRQRDNMLYANRQVSGVLTWLNTHGGDEILRRFDARTARAFRVQKVYPFVLGRYLAHFGDGPQPDRRAAWGTWPQILRLLDEQSSRGARANPIATLFTMLSRDTPLDREPISVERQEIALGQARITVFPSYAAFRARE